MCTVVCSIPSLPFDVCRVCSDIPCFITDISNLCLVAFALCSLSVLLEISQFHWSFQRTSLLFHWFSLLLFCFPYFFDFCSLFSFLLLALAVVNSSFSGGWCGNLDYCFQSFCLFLWYIFSAINLSTTLTVSHKFWYIVFSFSFSSVHFFRFPWDSFGPWIT